MNTLVKIGSMVLKNPVMNASGTFGYDDEYGDFFDINKLGAFVTKSITLQPRLGNPGPRITEVRSGMINSIGLQNGGVEDFIKNKFPKISKYKTNIIVSVAGYDEEEYLEVLMRLKDLKRIDGFELNVSCPNVKTGIAIGADAYGANRLVRLAKQIVDKPVIVKLSPNVTDIVSIAKACEEGGADGLTLINCLIGGKIDLKTRQPVLANKIGGFSGEAIKPAAIGAVYRVFKQIRIPIIGLGGISSFEDGLEFFYAGASAIGIGSYNFVDPNICPKIIDSLNQFLTSNNLDLKNIIGVGNQKEVKMTFLEKILSKQKENNSMVCVGLDSMKERLPKGVKNIFEFNKAIIDKTFDLACVYKLNLAFYEADGTIKDMRKTVQYIHEKGALAIADAKRGDIDHTGAAYAKSIFERFGFDAVTVNGYMGQDAIRPFSCYKDKGVIVVVRSSNPSAGDLQDIKDSLGKPVYMHLLELVGGKWNENKNLLAVSGATYPKEMLEMRKLNKDMVFLVPGIGKQGGDLAQTIANGLNEEGWGMMINSSREIIYASNDKNFADASRKAAKKLKDNINKYKNAKLILNLFEANVFKFGEFTLKSGVKSPIYVDLRPLVSYPDLLKKIAMGMSQLVSDIDFQVMAGIPYTGLPIATHLSLVMKKPMIYARKEVKDYGTKKKIEGVFNKGDKCLVIDDMITNGDSKFENIKPMEDEGMKVKDVIIVLDREQGGAGKLAKKGYRLHSLLKLSQVLEILYEFEKIDSDMFEKIKTYLKG